MERISRFRSMILLLLFSFVLVLYAGRLFFLQIIDTDGNTDNTATLREYGNCEISINSAALEALLIKHVG